MRKILQAALVAMMLVPTGAMAQVKEFERCGSAKRITCVVDGDTIWFEGEKIRMMGYDTPEPITNICGGQREVDLATAASDRLLQLLNENQFTIVRDGKDKYGRTLAVVRVGGMDIGDILIAEGLARSWPDGAEFWCE
ncbi:nuclease homologue [Roseovarius marisflavi]|uniref:Nuclease homologue n=1 Tax=Roseovarius marisflavi TaxID=1054996 RepID=A0A1M6XB64_9RHOB|nr:thermonuclease family protein [Roseovarius marisflavi]SHL03194.1 nuclease homologue [Roseovarius marisflavi]